MGKDIDMIVWRGGVSAGGGGGGVCGLDVPGPLDWADCARCQQLVR